MNSAQKNLPHKWFCLEVLSTDTPVGCPTVTGMRNDEVKRDVNVLNQWLMVACSWLCTPGEIPCQAPVGGSCKDEDASFLKTIKSCYCFGFFLLLFCFFKPSRHLIIKKDICFCDGVSELWSRMYFHLAQRHAVFQFSDNNCISWNSRALLCHVWAIYKNQPPSSAVAWCQGNRVYPPSTANRNKRVNITMRLGK